MIIVHDDLGDFVRFALTSKHWKKPGRSPLLYMPILSYQRHIKPSITHGKDEHIWRLSHAMATISELIALGIIITAAYRGMPDRDALRATGLTRCPNFAIKSS